MKLSILKTEQVDSEILPRSAVVASCSSISNRSEDGTDDESISEDEEHETSWNEVNDVAPKSEQSSSKRNHSA